MKSTWYCVAGLTGGSEMERIEVYQTEIADRNSAVSSKRPEAALWADADAISKHDAIAERFGPCKQVVLIGIGGSSLGVRAVYEALHPRGEAVGKLLVLDTVDPFSLREAEALLTSKDALSESVIVIVSKSGTTLETQANFEALVVRLLKVYSKEAIYERMVCISDPECEFARFIANEGGYVVQASFVSGRMSIGTAAGLVPLRLLGVDIHALALGMDTGAQAALVKNSQASSSALVWHLHYESGIRVREIIVPDPSLFALGLWMRQLIAESLGKEGKGFTPDISVATVDYHSTLQLRLDGSPLTATQFVTSVANPTADEILGGPHFEGVSISQIRVAIQQGVAASYHSRARPFEVVELPDITAQSIGEFLSAAMAEVMFLGHLWEVNTFDQPAVEDYKKVARNALNL